MHAPTITVSLIRVAENVYPDLDAVGGRGTLISIVGALLTITLIIAVLMMVISGIVPGLLSSSTGKRSGGGERQGRGVRCPGRRGPRRGRRCMDETSY